MAQTNVEKQRILRSKRRDEGRVPLQLWPLEKNKKAIKDFADKLDKG